MSFVETLLLGLVQGLTEFLPVSSSGHLVILQGLFGGRNGESGALLEVLLHVGTLIPVVILFRKQLAELVPVLVAPSRWMPTRTWLRSQHDETPDDPADLFRFVLVATFMTAVVALPLQSFFEPLFDSPRAAGVALLVTTVLLLLSRVVARRTAVRIGLLQAAVVGAAQALAVTPGISRSGTTIVVGLAIGIPLARAGVCSFVLSIPAICGGLVLELAKHPISNLNWGVALAGALVAGVSGYFAVRWTMQCITTQRLSWFAPYTFVLALAVLFLVDEARPEPDEPDATSTSTAVGAP